MEVLSIFKANTNNYILANDVQYMVEGETKQKMQQK